ncbi:MAG: type II toxin-antitoxin system RelE/ParE family toxin [Gallionellaceae bacterium]|jgi:hypothetical protein
MHNIAMNWVVLFHDVFELELQQLPVDLQDELFAHAMLLREFGHSLGRPTVDTLNGSKHANMKEMRFNWNKEVWRIAFAFDTKRHAILLVSGNKAGADQKRFYKKLIAIADTRFDEHLKELKQHVGGKKNG